MINVKGNFKGAYSNLVCDLCNKDEESQIHLLSCCTLLRECKDLYDDNEVEYEDIFSDIEKQLRAVNLFQKVLAVREKLLMELESDRACEVES